MSDTAPRFAEEDLLPISALQHLVFCERQFALMFVERVWVENYLTVEGRALHEQVDVGQAESRGDLRISRAVPLRSLGLGLVGKADVVEFRADTDGIEVRGWPGRWRPFPVEYKHGRPKEHRADEVQLAAQAICLEEMFATEVPRGALFYGKTRRRLEVEIDGELRAVVRQAADRAREILAAAITPLRRREPKCDHCSLLEICRPEIAGRSAVRYLEKALADELGRGVDTEET